jgi:hypothetical protein
MQITLCAQTIPTKTCSKCKIEKCRSEFSKSRFYADGYRGQCKKCRASYTVEYRARDGYVPPPSSRFRSPRAKEKQAAAFRARKIKKKYGITIQEYDAMLEKQGGGCALCGKKKMRYRLAIDHCHSTGKVRGILCFRCNWALGILGDTPAGVSKALSYIQS